MAHESPPILPLKYLLHSERGIRCIISVCEEIECLYSNNEFFHRFGKRRYIPEVDVVLASCCKIISYELLIELGKL